MFVSRSPEEYKSYSEGVYAQSGFYPTKAWTARERARVLFDTRIQFKELLETLSSRPFSIPKTDEDRIIIPFGNPNQESTRIDPRLLFGQIDVAKLDNVSGLPNDNQAMVTLELYSDSPEKMISIVDQLATTHIFINDLTSGQVENDFISPFGQDKAKFMTFLRFNNVLPRKLSSLVELPSPPLFSKFSYSHVYALGKDTREDENMIDQEGLFVLSDRPVSQTILLSR